MRKAGLNELDAVVAVARRRSFRAAANEMGMSTTALSNAVAGLEERVGMRLFHRTTRSVSLTEAGEQFVATVAPAVADIRRAMEAINTHRATPTGTLRINSSLGAAHLVLAPIILEYLRRCPEMRVDVVTGGFDAGIRLTEDVPRDMIAVPMGGPLRFAVVGAPELFRGKPRPVKPVDLASFPCICVRQASGSLYRW